MRNDLFFSIFKKIPNKFPNKVLCDVIYSTTLKKNKLKLTSAFSALIISKHITTQTPIILDNILENPKNQNLYLKFIAYKCLSSFFNELRSILFSEVSLAAGEEIAVKSLAHIHNLDLEYLQTENSGEISSALTTGSAALTDLLDSVFMGLLPLGIEFYMMSKIIRNSISKSAATLTFISGLGYSLFTVIVTERRTKTRRVMNQVKRKARGILVESVMNAESVRFNTNETYELSKFEEQADKGKKIALSVRRSLGGLNFGQQFILNLGLLGSLASRQNLKVALIANLYQQISLPLNHFGTLYRKLIVSKRDMEQLNHTLSIKPLFPDPLHPEKLPEGNLNIKFEDVSFKYNSEDFILQNINLSIPSGTTCAIVGESGSGKSTLLKLLYRLYMTSIVHNLRNRLSIVPQDILLFNTTILENIRYGKLNATFAEIQEVARKAQIHDFIESLPNVGVRGTKLAGGEKQRIGIARCLLRDSDVYLLDEATACLDANTEEQIVNMLENEKKTAIIIAHRLNTIKACDQIVYIKKGEIKEQGTFDELISINNGYFKTAWDKQTNYSV